MPANPKIVVRFNFPYDPAMAERFAREADIELRTCEREGAEDHAWAALNEAHVYAVSSAKDELPRRWFVTGELLQRCPKLLCVSTSGAGYDTVDVDACSKAGIIVVNQAGINAPAVAEHTLGMMLALSKRIAECDRRLRRERGFAREDLMGREISGKTLGVVGIGHVGTRVARLAQAFGMTVLAYDPYVDAEEIAAARRPLGAAHRIAFAIGHRVDPLSAHQRDTGHDRCAGLCPDEAGRAVRDHRARRHP